MMKWLKRFWGWIRSEVEHAKALRTMKEIGMGNPRRRTYWARKGG
ncbi:hypothetical protein SIID45300_02417 [Candidatus Magnetaquicoccaceae bacterium FCR-1]|uniref:Uncharacterized protein n=1 Tax=Candidatus Magnetaquiglobus chichijimensis TaxID=3141448 RepID=A0ABQ0CB44_9PROT